MAKKHRSKAASKAKIQKRALNAFEIAEKEEKRAQSGKNGYNDDSDSDDPYADPDASDNGDEHDEGEEEDEEIDSDEAFGSSDEEEILDSRTWRNKRKDWKKKKGQDSEDEDAEDNSDEEEGYDSIDESELLPLSAVWDLDDKDLEETLTAEGNEDANTVNEIKINEQAGASSSEESDSSEEDSDSIGGSEEDSDLSMSDEDFDEVDEEKLSSLRAMISDLSNTEMVTPEAASKNLKKQKLVQINNVSEGEFSVPTGSDGKLSLADLTNSINDTRAVASLSLLQDGSAKDKAAPLSVPLPKRLQERLDRGAAYDISKKEVAKWKDTIAANRNAEHLQFPINPGPEFTKPSSFATLEPETSLEKRVNSILEQSALADEKNEATFEQLAPSTLSMAELRKRRNELRMMRELMFREEQKAKRIKKIKSKTYRKIHKKQREREQQLVEGEEEDSDEAAADHDAARAEERMSLRHKNTGKWAKSMVQQGFTKDKATRSEMEEMLRRGEKLRTKIQGREDGAEEEYVNGDEDFLNERDASSDDEEVKRIKERAGKGVLAMKFMKDAEAAERKQNMLQKQELKDAMSGRSGLSDDDESKGANEIINEGRRKYAPGSKAAREEIDEVMDEVKDELEDDEIKSLENRLSQKRKRNPLTDREPESKSIRLDNTTAGSTKTSGGLDDFAAFDSEDDEQDAEDSEDEGNPWLAVADKGQSRKKKVVTVVGRDSSNAEKSQDRVRKQKEKVRTSNKRGSSVQDGIIDMNQTLKIVDPFGSDVESDTNDQEALSDLIEAKPSNKSNGANKRVSFKQTDLVKRAFAGDDVVAEFEEEKMQIAQEDGDKEVDVTLPGWGSWGGSDIIPKKKYVKKVKGVVNQKNRQDYNLDGVIINEKVNKKSAIYTATSVPFPFETREQYERSLRMPIGQEWSTRDTHQKLIKPRVIVKPGLVIDPIKAPFQQGEESD